MIEITEEDFSINESKDVLTNKLIGYYCMFMKVIPTKEEAEELKKTILESLNLSNDIQEYNN